MKVFSCIGFQQRKSLSSSWFNLFQALSRMESCLDQLFRWVILLLLMLVVLASYKFNQSNCLPWFCNIIRSIYWLYTWNFKFILSSESDWDWWARAVGGDKHNSSGIFFFLLTWDKEGKAQKHCHCQLSGGETWEVWQVEGDWRDTDLCRGTEVHRLHCDGDHDGNIDTLGGDWLSLNNSKHKVRCCRCPRCKQEGLSLDHVFRLDQFHRLP